MPTFKITSPEAVQACKVYEAAEQAAREAGRAFAAHYPGSQPVYSGDVSGFRLYGLKFSPVNESPLWTRPQRDGGETQRPRSAPIKNVKGDERRQQLADLKILNAEWAEHFPQVKVNRDPVLEAIGTDWGSALLNGIAYFEHAGAVYVRTGMKARDDWEEILNSEFDGAHDARLAALKAVAA